MGSSVRSTSRAGAHDLARRRAVDQRQARSCCARPRRTACPARPPASRGRPPAARGSRTVRRPPGCRTRARARRAPAAPPSRPGRTDDARRPPWRAAPSGPPDRSATASRERTLASRCLPAARGARTRLIITVWPRRFKRLVAEPRRPNGGPRLAGDRPARAPAAAHDRLRRTHWTPLYNHRRCPASV